MRQSLRHEIRALQRRLGVTTIMVTHDQEEALAMADRIVVMNHGVVEQVGAPVEVYTRPRSPFVARFVGQMNFLAAVARARAGLGAARRGGAASPPGHRGRSPAGTRLTLAIRPEEITVGAAARGAENRLVTRIRAIQFLGSFTRLSLAARRRRRPRSSATWRPPRSPSLGAAEGTELALVAPARGAARLPGRGLASDGASARRELPPRSRTAWSGTGWPARTWSATRWSPSSRSSSTSSCSTRWRR